MVGRESRARIVKRFIANSRINHADPEYVIVPAWKYSRISKSGFRIEFHKVSVGRGERDAREGNETLFGRRFRICFAPELLVRDGVNAVIAGMPSSAAQIVEAF